MFPHGRTRWVFLCVLLVLPMAAQQDAPNLNESGKVMMAGRSVAYLIRRLPVNAFPDLPDAVVAQLEKRQCLIPQTYEAHHPENVVHASLERAGSSDWAVLCSTNGEVSLMVFFGSAQSRPAILLTVAEKQRLQQHDSSGVLGFNWAIDPASPDAVHEAQSGLERKPPRVDHDALEDILIDQKTVYRFFSKGTWKLLDMP